MNDINCQTFRAMRRLFPSLPEHVTHFVLTMGPNQLPVIDIKYLVKGIGCVSVVEETASLEVDEDTDVERVAMPMEAGDA